MYLMLGLMALASGVSSAQSRPQSAVPPAPTFSPAPVGTTTDERIRVQIAAPERSGIDVYVGENDLDRIHLDAKAQYIPDAPEFGRRDCRVAEIEQVNLAVLDDPALASIHGGPLASRPSRYGAPLPVAATYRIRLDRCDPPAAPDFRLRGVAHIDADGRSLLWSGLRYVITILIRESGF